MTVVHLTEGKVNALSGVLFDNLVYLCRTALFGATINPLSNNEEMTVRLPFGTLTTQRGLVMRDVSNAYRSIVIEIKPLGVEILRYSSHRGSKNKHVMVAYEEVNNRLVCLNLLLKQECLPYRVYKIGDKFRLTGLEGERYTLGEIKEKDEAVYNLLNFFFITLEFSFNQAVCVFHQGVECFELTAHYLQALKMPIASKGLVV